MSPRLFKDLLKMLARAFYDEETVVILDYILFHGRVEEHEMAERMNLPIKHIRKSLNELRNHGILVPQAGKKDRKSASANGNMFSRGPDEDRLTYWSFEKDIVNVVKYRLGEVKFRLEKMVNDAENQSYFCPNCKKTYSVSEVLVNNSVCKLCIEKPALSQRCDNIEKAKCEQRIGLESLKPLEAKLQECSNICLPPEFFGELDVEPVPITQQTSKKHKIHTHSFKSNYHNGGIKCTEVDVIIAEDEKKEEDNEKQPDPDPEILSYYLALSYKKAKFEPKPEPAEHIVAVRGQWKPLRDITCKDEMRMTEEEHAAYCREFLAAQFSLR